MSEINIRNKRAAFEFQFLETFVAGMVLSGTEIKSIRNTKVSINEAYCIIQHGEAFIRNMHIAEYEKASFYKHEPRADRKLLLSKTELKRITKALKDKGITLIPIKLFLSDKGWAKLEIAIAKGKKLYDKREDLKSKDAKRELDRQLVR
ncbi:MAG TPA: SsrA-binding protein SmpB [Luteibaculaceae bacterium]|nr:SsrA-binding protein SmpB [Luteibaculaceae bacterium]